MTFKWDRWQEQVLEHEGNITIRAGRQVGKSEVISAKAANFAIKYEGTTTLITAASQRQSSLLFEKTKSQVESMGMEFAEEPTLTKMILKNGSKIYCLPTGRTGYFIRGFTIDLLIVDEAAYVPDEVYKAIIPMIAVSRKVRGLGWIILLSTPFGKGGYFYDSFHDEDFMQFHVSSEMCERMPKDFLLKEKQRLSKQDYAQEYLGEFIDDFRQYFATELIKRCMTFISWDFAKDYDSKKSYYLGVDVARYGGDENAFIVAELDKNNNVKIVRAETTQRKPLTDTAGYIKLIDEKWHFKKIFIDDGGIGGGLTDILLEKIGKKVMGLNNASKRVQIQGEEKNKGILKEDLYSNALVLMESKKIEIISDLSLLKSLKSIVFEYTSEKNLKLSGDYSHLCEAYVRACWCIKEKGLKPFLA